MDDHGQHENESHKMDHYRGVHEQWNIMPQYQLREDNVNVLNKKIMQAIAEKNAAIEELNRAIADRNAAIEERNKAMKLQNEAITARDVACRERDSAIAALRFQESSLNCPPGSIQRGTKRMHQSSEYYQEKSCTKEKKPKVPKKGKKVGEDLNKQIVTHGSKSGWDAQDVDLMEQINFDEATIPTPICTCTGVPRQCYKGGKGGWQSSCCTMSLSVYPLPQMPNRHSRINGRKMSRGVFLRVLSRVAAEGHDLSIPIDLRNYWGKHGTNSSAAIK